MPVRHAGALVGAAGALRVELLGGVREPTQELHLARVIPDARSHRPAGPRDAPHLPDSGLRVLHEVDDEQGERGVEGVVLERQRLRDALPDVGVREALAEGGGERL